MATYARRRKQMENRGSYRPNTWEEEQKEKKAQKKLDEYMEDDNEQR